MKISEDVAIEVNSPSTTILSNEEHLPLDVCLELEVRDSSFRSFIGAKNSAELTSEVLDVENVNSGMTADVTKDVTVAENNVDVDNSIIIGSGEGQSNAEIEMIDLSPVEKTSDLQVSDAVVAPEPKMDVAPMDDVSSVNEQPHEVKISQTNESRKRSLDEELEPALVRIPSKEPSPSADFIRINKDEFRIGRKPDNDEIILSVLISRNHCILKKDTNSSEWFLTNLSSTDTLLNEEHVERNQTVLIKEGDILQLSLADSFKYEFSYVNKKDNHGKHPRLESTNGGMDTVLDRQRSFVQLQENQRKGLEELVNTKQQEQEGLRKELETLLQEQKETKTCNEKLNTQISELQKKIEMGNSIEVELTEKYRDLLEKLNEEKLKFEEKLAEEKQKYQEVLRKTKQEKEHLELTMVEKVEECRVKTERRQQEEWQKKIDNLLSQEKNVQTQLQNEKQLLEQKLREMEGVLKQREQEQAKEREKIRQQQSALAAAAQLRGQKPCIVVLQPMNKVKVQPAKNPQPQTVKNPQQYSIVDTIDLTNENGGASTSSNVPKENAVMDEVNNIMDNTMTCSICSEFYVHPMITSCEHTFCQYCIDQWMKRQNHCPVCRTVNPLMFFNRNSHNIIEEVVKKLTPEQLEKRAKLVEDRKGKISHLKTVHLMKKVVRRR
ncbi:hypothetical protein QAD02_009226 [Eretmocerus hayati]|uniref:Uncharacterized protein n=1 Tax=Eretmocerus hayati TaxID=131215 RepID=A0ACC2N9Y1_9HYME|nr:hypothetical protein QAD02_009226 [Eretmocerus hayati]